MGTPIPQRRAAHAYQPLHFDKAEGEMFTCNLKGRRQKRTKKTALSNAPSTGSNVSTEEESHHDDEERDDVLVKVSCVVVYLHLVSPEISSSGIDLMVTNSGSSILEAALVDHVHYLATKNALVTVLHDLRKLGYTDFRPMETGKPALLWDAMTELVERLLLPMARLGVVHSDIRFGWDRTYLILSL